MSERIVHASATGPVAGFVHSFETGAAVDGPGMRFVLFTQGCQFRCLYCHNPDTWKLRHGRQMSVDEVLAEIRPYAGFLKIAGGLTVSGGEPLLQPDFVGAVLSRAKAELGLHTALDTQGFLAGHIDDAWLEAVDLVLLDIKHFDADAYQRLTGQPLQPTLDFAERLARLKKPVWLRYVLVPGLSDDVASIDGLADYAAGLGNVERVTVLPFHKLGEHKWRELGLDYQLGDTPIPDAALCERVREQFRARGLTTV
ncbi:pyruvate formate-lyase-activating protein [Neisseriaceae bacterium JH1-16]|nr:pyruvate formate-lyase-activating protein [Neisseriaceae bacterium JH1-16]